MGSKKVSGLKDHIGFWLRMISNNVSHAFARKLDASGVTVAEWVVLREIYEQGDRTSPGHVAHITGLTKGAISKLVERLLDKKLVTRESSLEDRRFQSLELTSAGRELIPYLARLADQNDQEYFASLSPQESRALVSILKKIAANKKLSRVPTE